MKYLLYIIIITLCPVMAFLLSLPVHAQSPIDGALATLQAATRQAEASQWERQAQATRQAQELAATDQAQSIETEATRQAIIVNASATAQTQNVELEITRQAHTANVGATATSQAMQVEYQATQIRVALDATRQAYDVSLAEMQERSDIGTALLYFSAFLSAIGLLVVLVWALGKLPKTKILKQPEIIEATWTSIPLLLSAPNPMTVTELPDELSDVIEDLVNNGDNDE